MTPTKSWEGYAAESRKTSLKLCCLKLPVANLDGGLRVKTLRQSGERLGKAL